VLELPSIARDIDRPEDLCAVAEADGERRSQKLLRSWNVAARVQGVHG
jgi:2-phospho-L-lactate guanylyltransferase (CobY/MobA/RfbA family)